MTGKSVPWSRRVGKAITSAVAQRAKAEACPPQSGSVNVDGGHAEPVIGRAFARPVGFAHPTPCY